MKSNIMKSQSINLNNTKENVTKIDINSVSSVVKTYLNHIENEKSKNSKVAYEYNINQFFNYICNKSVADLSEKDLKIKKSTVMQYRNFLRDKGYSANSINQKTHTLKSLFKFLKTEDYNVNPDVFQFENLKNGARSYDMLTNDEVFQMIELAKEERKGKVKSLLIEFAFRTAYRKDACLNVKWSDFRWNGEVYVIEIWDKGQLHRKSITKEFYDRLCEIKQSNDDDDIVFDLDPKTCNAMIRRFCEKLQIVNRYITFHSLKKSSIEAVKSLTQGDLDAIAKHGNHSPYTSVKYYNKVKDDPNGYPCLLIGQDIDLSEIEKLSREELVELIKGVDMNTQMKLLSVLKSKRG